MLLRYHMAVLTPDKRLKRAIKRVTTATASTAEFAEEMSALPTDPPVDLAIFDARSITPSRAELESLPKHAAISYILDGEGLTDSVPLLADHRVTSLLCHDEGFDDDEFIASATKALRRDVFGLQKYFPWGVTTYSMMVKSYEQKTRAIEIIMEYAREAGLRGPVRDRIQLVSDELMMNALYHAPVDDRGNELYASISRKELASLDEVQPIEIHYGCSGRYFGLSIRDGGGSLTRTKALEYLMRARQSTAVIENKATGAGLGLISVLRSVSKLIFNLDPGNSTEVIALFDVDLISRGKVGARSLHIFVADPEQQAPVDTVGAFADDTPSVRSRGPWALILIVLALLAVAAGIYYTMRAANQPAEISIQEPTISVLPKPADAEIRLNGKLIRGGHPVPLPPGSDSYQLEVTSPGHKPWSTTITPEEARSDLRLYVTLDPSK